MQNVGIYLSKNMLRVSAIFGVFLVLAMSSVLLISASAATYSVSLQVTPEHPSYPPGGQPAATLTATNNGRSTFNAKTCTITVSGPNNYHHTLACPTDFKPFSIAPGKTFTHFYLSFVIVPSKAPKGAYNFVVFLDGTVTGKPFRTMSATFQISVT